MESHNRHDEAAASATDPYRELFERSADAILIIQDERFVDCNEATVRMMRFETRAQVLGTHPSKLSPPRQPDGRDSFAKANEMMATAFEKGSHRFEWDHVRADGEVFPVEVLLTAVPSAGHQVLHVVWRDITERKRLEEAVRQSQKMEALGRLAGGIAHDFNNLLVAIMGNAELLADMLQQSPDALELVHELLSASGRAAALVRQLLTFSRRRAAKLMVVELRPALVELERMLRRLIGEGASLIVRTAIEPVWVEIGEGYFEQIAVNLVTNARDALDEGGTIEVSLDVVDLGDDEIRERLRLASGPHAVLTVSDDGVGMSKAVAERAFDPFFTTKEVGKGTGLGLATVYGLATQARGGVDLRSEPGHGTSVRVYLPLTTRRPPDAVEREAPRRVQANAVILLVEDQVVVSNVLRRALELVGYEVLVANDGIEGLTLWAANADRVNLVLSDLSMPRLGGVAMLGRLRAQGYAGPVLFMSGHASPKDGVLELEAGAEILPKPLSHRELVEHIEKALGTR
jgi:two-component system cell cycle sensor histidine kinase/response regulator CckA